MYLMREGVIFANTPAAATLPDAEVDKRVTSFNTRRSLVNSNPSLYISKTRLSLRQLPPFATDRLLKRLAIHATREFEDEAKEGTRKGLAEDELADDTYSLSSHAGKKKRGERQTPVCQAKIVRQTDRLDPLTGLGKSKGYGFLEMRTHKDALRVLRWANNNPEVGKLMKEWWTVELGDLVERAQTTLDGFSGKPISEATSTNATPAGSSEKKMTATTSAAPAADSRPAPRPGKVAAPSDAGEADSRLRRL